MAKISGASGRSSNSIKLGLKNVVMVKISLSVKIYNCFGWFGCQYISHKSIIESLLEGGKEEEQI